MDGLLGRDSPLSLRLVPLLVSFIMASAFQQRPPDDSTTRAGGTTRRCRGGPNVWGRLPDLIRCGESFNLIRGNF
jgi:hypothetical protein